MTFDEWLQYGIDNKFCSEQFCLTHEGEPITETEEVLWSAGQDPCAHMVRLGDYDRWEEDATAYAASV
jgi:hypothetical protein